jgi:hypothetical protein
MSKRYTLNVSRGVHLAIQDRRIAALRKTGTAPTVDELLRALLRMKTGVADEPAPNR